MDAPVCARVSMRFGQCCRRVWSLDVMSYLTTAIPTHDGHDAESLNNASSSPRPYKRHAAVSRSPPMVFAVNWSFRAGKQCI